jgi:hypothetical protein
MRKSGGGFGFLVAIAAALILLFLSMKAWKAAYPSAVQALQPDGASAAPRDLPDHGRKPAGDSVRSGNLPDLKTTGQRTDQHIQQIQDAAKDQD